MKQTSVEAQEKAAKIKAVTDSAAAEVQHQLRTVKQDLVRAQDEITNLKASHAEHLKLAKHKVEQGGLQVSALHYQMAEKDKKIHALESVVKRAETELEHEKEMHEASKGGLHEAMERLMDMKRQRS